MTSTGEVVSKLLAGGNIRSILESSSDDIYARQARRDELSFDHGVVFSIQFFLPGATLSFDKECFILSRDFVTACNVAKKLCKLLGYDYKLSVVQYAYEPVDYVKKSQFKKYRLAGEDVYSVYELTPLREAKAIKGTGKRIDYEDDLVVVYDANGNEIYKGLEDYEPMKYEDWEFDNSLGAYRLDGYVKVCL